MSSKPLVSIVIPTYNRATLIERAINSVLAQSLQDFEIIVVDDASQDNTEAVIKSLTDSRLKYFKHQTNLNGSTARNTGIKAARGTYLALLDSDDEWLPNHLAIKITYLQNNNCQGVFGSYYIYYSEELIREIKCQPRGSDCSLAESILSGKSDTRTSTFVFETAAIREIMFDETLGKHQDWDLAIRFARVYHFGCETTSTVIAHYDRKQSISSSMNHEASQLFLKRYRSELGDRTLARFYLLVLALRTLNSEGRNKRYREYLKLANSCDKKGTYLKLANWCLAYPFIDLLFVKLHQLRQNLLTRRLRFQGEITTLKP